MTDTMKNSNWKYGLMVILSGIVVLFVSLVSAQAQTGERSKSAYNITQGRNAESVDARESDIIEYRLTFRNTLGSTQNVTIEDNISDVLRLSEIDSLGGGERNGDTIRFPGISVSANSTVDRTFRVRIKSSGFSGPETMQNTYGNTVYVRVRTDDTGSFGQRSKSAHNQTQNMDATRTNAVSGDLIEYRLRFYNDSSSSRTVTIEDDISDVLKLATVTSLGGGALSGSVMRFPQETVSGFATVEKRFQILVKDIRFRENDMVMTNNYGNSVSITVRESEPSTKPSGGTSSATHSKTAFNRTQGQNAESVYARPGDTIDYTLTYRNTENQVRTITIEDEISDVLDLAEVVNYGGGELSGNVLRFHNISVPANGRVDRTFQVRVKNVAANKPDLMMSNFYGIGIDIRVQPTGTPQPIDYYIPQKGQPQKVADYVAPPTGPQENFALLFAMLLTGGIFVYKKYPRQKIVRE